MRFQGTLKRLVLLLLAGLVSLTARAAGEPPAVADFFRRPTMSDAVLSPSGRYVAATAPANGRRGLIVVDLSVEPFVAKGLIGYAGADVVDVRWVNDDRIANSLSGRDSSRFETVGRGLFVITGRAQTSPGC